MRNIFPFEPSPAFLASRYRARASRGHPLPEGEGPHYSTAASHGRATALIPLGVQGDRRVLLEPRGSRRMSSQSPLDLRLSKTIMTGESARFELLVDVLNVLNDTAEAELASDNLFSQTFGRPSVFMDPRRAVFGVRLKLGHE